MLSLSESQERNLQQQACVSEETQIQSLQNKELLQSSSFHLAHRENLSLEYLFQTVALDSLDSFNKRIHHGESGVSRFPNRKTELHDQAGNGKLKEENHKPDSQRYPYHIANLRVKRLTRLKRRMKVRTEARAPVIPFISTTIEVWMVLMSPELRLTSRPVVA